MLGKTGVGQASKKITEKLLKLCGHVMRRNEEHIVKRALMTDIPERRKDDQRPGGNMPVEDT